MARKHKMNLIGKRFDQLVVIEKLEERHFDGSIQWRCKCDCGGEAIVTTNNLNRGATRSCGCLKGSHNKNLVGKRFGRLVPIRALKERKFGGLVWVCQCDCGNIHEVTSGKLIAGEILSCGCLKDEAAERNYKEGTSLLAIVPDKKLIKSNTSGHTGVTWDKSRQKWMAYIVFQQRKIHLGRFSSIEEAVIARKEGEREYFAPILDKYSEEDTKE